MVCVYSKVESMLKGKINRSKMYFTTVDDYFLPPTASLISTIFTDVSTEKRDETRPIETEPILLLTTQVFDETTKVAEKTAEVTVRKDVGKLKEKRQQKVTFKEQKKLPKPKIESSSSSSSEEEVKVVTKPVVKKSNLKINPTKAKKVRVESSSSDESEKASSSSESSSSSSSDDSSSDSEESNAPRPSLLDAKNSITVTKA